MTPKGLAEHIAPDTVAQLLNAAETRLKDARILRSQGRFLAALYLMGYSVEMCLTAAFFRQQGFGSRQTISREIRNDRIKNARNRHLMSSEPHDLIGWAKYLLWLKNAGTTTPQDTSLLNEALSKATTIYRHWRPALRYKNTQVTAPQLSESLRAAEWFVENRDRL